MKLIDQIREAENQGGPMTFKQGPMLFALTGLKFWEPVRLPKPTVRQASILIDACLKYIETKENGREILEVIQIWFPSFDDEKNIHFRRRGKQHKDPDPAPQQQPEPTKTPKFRGSGGSGGGKTSKRPGKTEPSKSSEPSKSPSKPAPAKPKEVKGCEYIEQLIDAGIRNIWMVGPAGCGKTTIATQIGEHLELPVTIIPCGAGTSATTFLGYKYPEREDTPFVGAFSQPGIIVLDEFTALEAQVAQIVNGALANGELHATTGSYQRADDLVIIATSNTFGHGADRVYVSNNQLDASTRDRFAGGIVEIDYSEEYENQYDPEVVAWVRHIRLKIHENGMRKVASTRSIISACLLKDKGMDWKASLTADWTSDEKALL